jgi:hypothetical protein
MVTSDPDCHYTSAMAIYQQLGRGYEVDVASRKFFRCRRQTNGHPAENRAKELDPPLSCCCDRHLEDIAL